MSARKKILITSGGTFEKWDNVRGHTNLSKGTIGSHFADYAYKNGLDVIYMHGIFTKLPKCCNEIKLVPFDGIEDLQEKVRQIILSEKIDIVIMAVAGSDWLVDKIYDQEGKEILKDQKIPSDVPPIIHFRKAPKILSQIKTSLTLLTSTVSSG